MHPLSKRNQHFKVNLIGQAMPATGVVIFHNKIAGSRELVPNTGAILHEEEVLSKIFNGRLLPGLVEVDKSTQITALPGRHQQLEIMTSSPQSPLMRIIHSVRQRTYK